MLPLLRSRNLVSFIEGTSPCPSAFLKDADGNLTDAVNPAFEIWVQQDATVLSWINSSVHPTILAALIGKTSSHSAWTTLRDRYASRSTGRLLQLRSELMNTHRGDSSISEFLDKINCLADTLSLSGASVSDSDIVAIILNNVGPAYESTVASAQARHEAITYSALEALLLGAERRQKMHSAFTADTDPTAFAATCNGGRPSPPFRGRGFSSGLRGGGNGGRSSFSRHGSSHGSPSLQPDGLLGPAPSQTSFPNGRLQCQICTRYGHSAIDCYNCLNMSYEGRVPAPKLQAYAASAPTIQNWLFDSGANAHITNDPAQVTNARPYHGTDQVNGVVGGTGLKISHVGNTCIRTPQALFHLPNTLLCPNASPNIISIHRFTTDNNCSLTLFPHAYRV
ncbi:hypothetical protein ACFX1S_036761 [Malus domestica]